MDLNARIVELERRVEALETGNGAEGREVVVPVDDLWACNQLHQDFAAAGEKHGGVIFAGAVRLPTDERYGWQKQFTTDEIIADDSDEAAECLAALGSPVRLRLLRAILGGRRTAAELAELDGVGTSGQIYHHLRQLAAVGWLHTAGRGRFEVPAGRVVPLLVALASARR